MIDRQEYPAHILAEAARMRIRYWVLRQATEMDVERIIKTIPGAIEFDAYCNKFYPFPEERK